MAKYKVSATISGNRIVTDSYWLTRSQAQKYADETNMFHRNARARVIKV